MDKFEHLMRTNQHARSVQMIMTRTNHTLFKSKQPNKKLNQQGDNISTYLRKVEIDRENLNLAKRIMQCQSEHSRDRYIKEFEKLKNFMKVRSNFKKTMCAKQPKIYKFEPILGHGKIQVDIAYLGIEGNLAISMKKNLHKFIYQIGSTEIEPDKKLITLDNLKDYSSKFYINSKKKKIICKIFHVHQNSLYEAGHFQVNLTKSGHQQIEILSKLNKNIGQISLTIKIQGKHFKKDHHTESKQNLPCIQKFQDIIVTQKLSYERQI